MHVLESKMPSGSWTFLIGAAVKVDQKKHYTWP